VIASEMLPAAVVSGSTTLSATLTVENPEIWRTAGELAEEEKQENKRYDLSVTAGDDAEITHHIAFRTLELTAGEGSFGFRVNGRPVFAKGAAWIPADALPSRQTPERYKDLLTSAVQANMNMIRVWGGGQYEQEVFYDLCDRLGLMVWQDCMFACAMYPALPEFLASVEKELAYQVPRLQSHPCIALWCGNNENLGALSWFPESRENRDRYLIDYDRLYYGVVEKAVRTYDPDRAWWPSSPSGGEGVYSDNWHSDTRGDMHVWSVWHEKKSFDEYLTVRPLFVSEFGYESFPSVEEIQTYAPAAQMNMTSPVMEYHQRSAGGNSIILENFSRYFRFPEGFENMVYLSQVQQAVALRTAVEYWHSLRPHCSGTIYWQLNDVWPDASWSSLEYSGRWKLLHYAAKDFFAPVTLSLYKKDGMFRAFVINDTSGPVAGRVTVSCLRFDGYPAGKPVSVMVPVPAGSSVKVWELPEAELPGAPEKCFFYARLSAENSTGKQFSAENTLFPSLYKNCDLPAGKIAAEITASGSETFSIKLSATVPAFFTSLSSGEIRGIFSRNLFTLLPGMPVTVTFTPGKKHVTIETLRKALTVKTLRDSYSPEAIESVPAEEPARSR
jgi:beta-mannosidase